MAEVEHEREAQRVAFLNQAGLGEAARVPLPVAAAAREAFSAARARGAGGRDFSAMVDVLCDIAQIQRARLE